MGGPPQVSGMGILQSVALEPRTMKFKEIDAFRAVMRCGSMTAAAAELFTSQPNVSRLIGQLEAATRLQLFVRSPGRLEPTEEALVLYREVERTFVGLETLEACVSEIRQFGSGRLRIACVPSLALSVLPKAVQRFSVHHPKVTIAIHTSDTHTVAHWAAQHSCDFGLVSYLPDAHSADLEQLCEVAATCVLPRRHRLARKPRIAAADLAGEAFISMAQGDGLRARVDAAFADDDRRVMLYETPYAATICQMVGLGLGASIVNPLVARDYLRSGIRMRPFDPEIRFTSYLLRPAHRPRSALVERFTAVLRAAVADELEALRDAGGI